MIEPKSYENPKLQVNINTWPELNVNINTWPKIDLHHLQLVVSIASGVSYKIFSSETHFGLRLEGL